MKNRTRSRIGWIAPLLALALALSACGGESTAATTTVPAAPTTTEATTETPTTETPTTETPTTEAPTTTVANEGPFATVEAANGIVEIPSRPTSIVSLSPTATEMLFAIGAGEQVVAVDEFSYYPEEAPVTDLSGFTPNLEAIGAYGPDLVVVSNDTDGIVGALTGVGVPVLLLPAAVEFSDVSDQMRTLGVATGNVDAAEVAARDFAADIQAAIDDAGDLAEGMNVYHELDPTLYSVTSDTFVGRVYAAFGLVNIADAADVDGFGYPQLSAEYVIEADPDLVFVTDCCGDTPETVADRPGWDNISAIESGAVIVVGSDISSRWGPRLGQFFRAISDTIVEMEG